jgi:hypothetical protein
MILTFVCFYIILNLTFIATGQTFDPATSNGTFGPFVPARAPSPLATGGPTTVSNQQAVQMANACNQWVGDTGAVTTFLNLGQVSVVTFEQQAKLAFNAETDELNQKATLDSIIGNDPIVSIANLTLTNGAFQSVLNNLQVMSTQGKGMDGLINTINEIRCLQILPSIGKLHTLPLFIESRLTFLLIDAYCAIASQLGHFVQVAAVRPIACTKINAQDQNPADYPNVPGTPGFTAQPSAQAPAAAAATPTPITSASSATTTTPSQAAASAVPATNNSSTPFWASYIPPMSGAGSLYKRYMRIMPRIWKI